MRKFLFVVALASLTQSCIFLAAPAAKKAADHNLTVEKNAIPPEIGIGDTYVVFLLQERESRDKYLRNHVKAHYNGKYVFATFNELGEKYTDKKKYRFVFTYTKLEGSKSASDAANPTSRYFIVDRKDNTEYNSGFHSSMFGKVIESYAKNMELQRQANQGAN